MGFYKVISSAQMLCLHFPHPQSPAIIKCAHIRRVLEDFDLQVARVAIYKREYILR